MVSGPAVARPGPAVGGVPLHRAVAVAGDGPGKVTEVGPPGRCGRGYQQGALGRPGGRLWFPARRSRAARRAGTRRERPPVAGTTRQLAANDSPVRMTRRRSPVTETDLPAGRRGQPQPGRQQREHGRGWWCSGRGELARRRGDCRPVRPVRRPGCRDRGRPRAAGATSHQPALSSRYSAVPCGGTTPRSCPRSGSPGAATGRGR